MHVQDHRSQLPPRRAPFREAIDPVDPVDPVDPIGSHAEALLLLGGVRARQDHLPVKVDDLVVQPLRRQ